MTARAPTTEPAPDGELRTRVCSFGLDRRGFVRATMDDDTRFELEDAVAAIEAMWQVSGGTRRAVLVDMRALREQSREARAYFAGEEAAQRMLAVALLAGRP